MKKTFLICCGLFIVAAHCQITDDSSDIENMVILLAATSSSGSSASNATTTCSTSSSSPTTITNPGSSVASHVISRLKSNDVACFYLYTNDSGSTKNITVTLKPTIQNLDLAIKNDSNPGAAPSDSLTSQCTSIGWTSCSTNTGTNSDSLTVNSVTTGSSIAFAVANDQTVCVTSSGCPYTIDISEL